MNKTTSMLLNASHVEQKINKLHTTNYVLYTLTERVMNPPEHSDGSLELSTIYDIISDMGDELEELSRLYEKVLKGIEDVGDERTN